MISAQPPSAVTADLAWVAGRDRALSDEATAYRRALSPWCIVRLLPNMQRLTVARFRKGPGKSSDLALATRPNLSKRRSARVKAKLRLARVY